MYRSPIAALLAMLRRIVALEGTVPLHTVATVATSTSSGVTAVPPPGRSSTR